MDYLVKRVGGIMPDNIDFASKILQDFAKDWEDAALENSNTLHYRSYSGHPGLLSSAEEDSDCLKSSIPFVMPTPQ
ncbi:MAG: hypothetical protein FWG09_03670 [Synergistaceae bacterium]|nr:hypothetical protein [Synergistaceae bacterium]